MSHEDEFLKLLQADEEERENEFLSLREDGDYIFRFVYNQGDKHKRPFIQAFGHYNFLDPNTGKAKYYKCLGSACPFCEYSRKLKAKGYEDAYWNYKAKVHYLYRVVFQKRARLLKLSTYVQEQLIGLPGKEPGVLTRLLAGSKINAFDLYSGRLVKISKRTNPGEFPTAKVIVDKKETALSEEEIEAVRLSRPLESYYRAVSMGEAEVIVDFNAKNIGDYTSYSTRVQATEFSGSVSDIRKDLVLEDLKDFKFDDED